MDYTIEGEIAQCVRLTMARGETAWVSKGGLMAYDPSIRWNLRVPGGLGGAVSRSLSGEGIALNFVESDADGAAALLASSQPGHVAIWNLGEGPVVTTRGSFLAAFGVNVRIDITAARRVGAAFFGGAGLFLQKVSGDGTVLIHGSGDFHERRLADGEEIIVSTGHLAAFDAGVDYDIKGVGGCRRILFSGEGFFMTRLRGPGRVLLQTLKRTPIGGGAAGAGR